MKGTSFDIMAIVYVRINLSNTAIRRAEVYNGGVLVADCLANYVLVIER